jgi:hypothetical protein
MSFDRNNLEELLADAETCARLSNWERQFLDDIRDRFAEYGTRIKLSEKQLDVLERIENKVYCT